MSNEINISGTANDTPSIVEVFVDKDAASSVEAAVIRAEQVLNQTINLISGIDNRNTILFDAGYVKTNQQFIALANTRWNIGGVEYFNDNQIQLHIDFSAIGKQRWVRICLDRNNSFFLLQGEEMVENPPLPVLFDNTLGYTFFLVTDTNVGNPTSPITGEINKTKNESNFFSLNGLHANDYIDHCHLLTEASHITLNSISEIRSLVLKEGFKAYPGKQIIITNNGTANLKIKSNHPENVKFVFPNGSDYIAKPKESVVFYLSADLTKVHFLSTNTVSATVSEETAYNFTDFYRTVAPDFLTFITGSTYRLNNSYHPIGLIDLGAHNILFYTPASAAYSGMVTGFICQGKGFTTWGNFFLYEVSYTDIYCQFGAFEIANHCYLEIDTNTLKFRVKSNKENVGFASPDSSYTASKGVMYSFIYNYVNENLVKIRVVNVLTNEIVYSYNLTTNIPPSYRFMNHGFRMNRLNNTQAGNDTLCMDSYGIAQKTPNFLKKYLL